ncbi:MAG: hypothetical protein ACP5NC_03150 [Nitrososphaeria archaeon]
MLLLRYHSIQIIRAKRYRMFLARMGMNIWQTQGWIKLAHTL